MVLPSAFRCVLLLTALVAAGCATTAQIPLCGLDDRPALLGRIGDADRRLAAGDTTGAWWGYAWAVVLPGAEQQRVCRDRLQEPGAYGRALAFAATHADVYARDSTSAWRRSCRGPVHLYVDGTRLDSLVVRLYRVDLPAVLAAAR